MAKILINMPVLQNDISVIGKTVKQLESTFRVKLERINGRKPALNTRVQCGTQIEISGTRQKVYRFGKD